MRNTLQGESSQMHIKRLGNVHSINASVNARIEYTCAVLLNRACPTLTFKGDRVVRGKPTPPVVREVKDTSDWDKYNALIKQGRHLPTKVVGQMLNVHTTSVRDLWSTHAIHCVEIGNRVLYTSRSVARLMVERHNDKTNPYQMNDEQRRFANRHGGGHGRPAKDSGRTVLGGA